MMPQVTRTMIARAQYGVGDGGTLGPDLLPNRVAAKRTGKLRWFPTGRDLTSPIPPVEIDMAPKRALSNSTWPVKADTVQKRDLGHPISTEEIDVDQQSALRLADKLQKKFNKRKT